MLILRRRRAPPRAWARGYTDRCRRASFCAASGSSSARRRSRRPRLPSMPTRSTPRWCGSPARIALEWAACSRPSGWPTRNSSACPVSRHESAIMPAGNSHEQTGHEIVAGMLQADSLRGLARVRHAFFTREGGVSEGVYASLNGGPGSDDAPANVAENRARMAAALEVDPHCLLTAYQVHSPDVVTIERPWHLHERPRVDDLGHCTYANAKRFFSYRRSSHCREPDYGRHISAIALAE